jgi:hypothetical protein
MKKTSRSAGDFLEDFSEWMGSREGLESMETLDCVFNALDGSRVDPSERKIIWSDDQGLSIEQSVERIHRSSGLDRQSILSHLIGWLQMEYEPQGLDEDQMEQFENQIDAWIAQYEVALPTASDF